MTYRTGHPNYLGFFECFNSQKFFEAHEVLEKLWLPNRQESDGRFYKGLIQLAGAFVHVQKGRTGPATSLLKLARANLEGYPHTHQGLDLAAVRELIEVWLIRLGAPEPAERQFGPEEFPKIRLIEPIVKSPTRSS